MKIYHNLQSVNLRRLRREKYLTIGVFDGLHLGHQLLIEEMVTTAQEDRALSVILTFNNHPLEVLAPAYCPQRLLDPGHKLELLKNMAPDFIIQVRFDKRFARIRPGKFVEKIIVNKIRAKRVFCGDDFRFGDQGQGNVSLLKRLGKAFGYNVRVVPAVRKRGVKISSTLIRELIKEGEMEEAEVALGRPFEIRGRVVKGTGRGRQLGYPTANLRPSGEMVQPPVGAYAVIVERADKLYAGMMYLGTKPTFQAATVASRRQRRRIPPDDTMNPLGYEVHIFAKTPSLYRKKIGVKIIKRLRNEMTFPSASTLKAQLATDASAARSILSHYARQKMLSVISS